MGNHFLFDFATSTFKDLTTALGGAAFFSTNAHAGR